MSSKKCGAVVTMQKSMPLAIWSYCCNHNFNLVVSKSANVKQIRNCSGTIQSTISFLQASAKRNFVLSKMINVRLSKLCETRWVERHTAVKKFNDNLTNIDTVLLKLCDWDDDKTSRNAKQFHASIDSEFIVSLNVLSFLFQYTSPLSKILQKVSLNYAIAYSEVNSLLITLKEKRNEAEICFKDIWSNILESAFKINIEVSKPRTVGRQVHRDNYDGTPEEYFRRSVFIPVLDEIISALEQNFSETNMELLQLSSLLPENIAELDVKSLCNNMHEKYSNVLNVTKSDFSSELIRWKNKWLNNTIVNAADILQNQTLCELYPNIVKLIKIYKTIPSSVASGERSFSALRRLKTWLRNTTSEGRLVGLALIHINYDMDADIEKVIEIFSNKKNRKIEFLL